MPTSYTDETYSTTSFSDELLPGGSLYVSDDYVEDDYIQGDPTTFSDESLGTTSFSDEADP